MKINEVLRLSVVEEFVNKLIVFVVGVVYLVITVSCLGVI